MNKPKITYSLPRFDDWQADAQWRVQLEADAYVDTFPVGRDVYLTGRVSWRTIPGKPDSEGWQYGGSYLYRVESDGNHLLAVTNGTLEPTEKMVNTVREAVAPELVGPSDTLRLETAKRLVKSLELQRVAWVRGVYLPPEITLAAGDSGIRLAGS